MQFHRFKIYFGHVSPQFVTETQPTGRTFNRLTVAVWGATPEA